MIYGFYFRFYKYLHNEKLSVFLAYITRYVFLCSFQLKRLFYKKKIISMSVDDALSIISKEYSHPIEEPIYINEKINPSIDLSIVVPSYNYVDKIDENIQSILKQKTRYTFELIIVDDGSTDGTQNVLKKYINCINVKVIFQSNMGIAGARNTGINTSTGKYLMFVDCDDRLHDDIVEALLDRAYEGDNDIVMCGHNLVKEKGGNIVDIIPNIYTKYNLMGYENNDEIMNYAGLPWGKVYKRNLFDSVRFFPLYWYEDTIIQFLIFTQCKNFSFIPKIGYDYKWNENNFSHTQEASKNSKVIDRYWLLVTIIEQYKKNDMPIDVRFYTLLIRHLSMYYYKNISILNTNVVEALFILANDLLVKYQPGEPYKLPFMLKETEKAIIDKDINRWILATKYQ